MAACLAAFLGRGADSPPPEFIRWAERARGAVETARREYEGCPTNALRAWRFGQACFDGAELATNQAQRASLAHEGIAACRQAARLSPREPAAAYYLALNLGQKARTQGLGALRTVQEMEHALERALELDATFDYAGPDRTLGLLYLDAPGWPLSVGSMKKARLHLERAAARSADYPENRLNLAEARSRWKAPPMGQGDLDAIAASLARARTNLVGEAWAANWVDWDRRWEAIRRRADKPPP
jgi:hypothetical protein